MYIYINNNIICLLNMKIRIILICKFLNYFLPFLINEEKNQIYNNLHLKLVKTYRHCAYYYYNITHHIHPSSSSSSNHLTNFLPFLLLINKNQRKNQISTNFLEFTREMRIRPSFDPRIFAAIFILKHRHNKKKKEKKIARALMTYRPVRSPLETRACRNPFHLSVVG